MNANLVGHDTPVNFQAAKIFWKAPWWAKLNEDDKEVLIHSTIKVEDLVDVFSPPPQRPGGIRNQIDDFRGRKVRSKISGQVALVLGYAYSKQNNFRGCPKKRFIHWQGHGWIYSSGRGEPKYGRNNYWYAFLEGEVQIICLSNGKWKEAGNYAALTPPNTTQLEHLPAR